MSLADQIDSPFAPSELRVRGRAARLPAVLGVRALELDEVAAHTAREAGTKPSALVRLSSRHRQLARLIASGVSTTAAALAVGLTVSRVSSLKSDKNFIDLVEHCKVAQDLAYQSYHEQLAGLSEDAVAELRERVETEPESFENGELLDIIRTTADRTGYAPKRVEEKNINVNFGDRLDEARKRALEGALITSVVEEATLVPEGEPS